MLPICTIVSLRCAVRVSHCRNSHSILLHYELTVTQSIQGIQESAWKLLPRNICPVPRLPTLPRGVKMENNSESTRRNNFSFPLQTRLLWKLRVLAFFRNYVPGKTWHERLLKASAQASFPTQTLLIKARTGASQGSRREGHPWLSALVVLNSNSVLDATVQLMTARVSHVLTYPPRTRRLSCRCTNLGRFALRLGKVRRRVVSHRLSLGSQLSPWTAVGRRRQRAEDRAAAWHPRPDPTPAARAQRGRAAHHRTAVRIRASGLTSTTCTPYASHCRGTGVNVITTIPTVRRKLCRRLL